MNHSPASTSPRSDTCAVLLAMVFPTFLTLFYFVLAADYPAEIQQTIYSIGKIIQFAFPLVWVLAVQRRQLRWKSPSAAGLAEGVGFGVLVLAAMLVLYHAWLKPADYFVAPSDAIRQKVAGIGLDSLWKYVALGTFYALLHSLLEEYYWRWFVFGQLSQLISLRMAVLVSSLGFMAHHVLLLGTFFGWLSIATVVFSLAVAVGGAVWAGLYYRSGSLYGPWFSHLFVDAGVFVIGYDLVRDMFAS